MSVVELDPQVDFDLVEDDIVKVRKLRNLGDQSEGGSDQEKFERAGSGIVPGAGRRLVTFKVKVPAAPLDEHIFDQLGGGADGGAPVGWVGLHALISDLVGGAGFWVIDETLSRVGHGDLLGRRVVQSGERLNPGGKLLDG